MWLSIFLLASRLEREYLLYGICNSLMKKIFPTHEKSLLCANMYCLRLTKSQVSQSGVTEKEARIVTLHPC